MGLVSYEDEFGAHTAIEQPTMLNTTTVDTWKMIEAFRGYDTEEAVEIFRHFVDTGKMQEIGRPAVKGY